MKKILVADQEPAICMLYAEELMEEGYNVVTISDRKDCVKIIGAESPDLILMDTGMDEEGVWSLLEGMRRSGYRLPVILCTAYSASKGFPEALVDDTVMKSSHFDELKLKIKKILGNGAEFVAQGTRLVEGKGERGYPEQMRLFFQEYRTNGGT